jgi:type VI secretion system secreted protein VgrG
MAQSAQTTSNGAAGDQPASANDYSQATRPLQVTTPLGDNVLLITGFSGFEAISRLFHFHLTLAAPDQTVVDFSQLLGSSITTSLILPGGDWRYFNGICSSVTQGIRRQTFTFYDVEVVPTFWRLTQNYQSRIFQRLSVPQILQQVLSPIPYVTFQISGNFQPREYCVQYRESDHDFACRLMEEEGIFFYFIHSADRHEMIVTDQQSFPSVDPSNLVLQPVETGVDDDPRIFQWEKQQRLQTGRVTLHDHTFELPHDHLEGTTTIQPSVAVGQITHDLSAGQATSMEAYDWPGEFAWRFDSIDQSGNNLGSGPLAKIPPDSQRTTGIRMQQIAASSIVVIGQSNCRQLVSGHSFSIQEVPVIPYNGSSSNDGQYVLTSVDHRAELGLEYRSGDTEGQFYGNRFICIPSGLPYSPARVTPRPVIQGPQTAVVVKGPGGDEIFTDPYGRVKVQFHWDRSGAPNPDSSCWIRVAHHNSGGNFGMIYIPRGDQEVIVQFEEGNPDRPIIIGSVYNPNIMPTYVLPTKKMVSGFRSNTYPGGGGNNEISSDDTKDGEQIFTHAQKDTDTIVENDTREHVLSNRHMIVGNPQAAASGSALGATAGGGSSSASSALGAATSSTGGNQRELVTQNKDLHVIGNHTELVEGNMLQTIGTGSGGGNVDIVVSQIKKELIKSDGNLHVQGDRKIKIEKTNNLHVQGDNKAKIDGDDHLQVQGDSKTAISGDESLSVTGDSKQAVTGDRSLSVTGDSKTSITGDRSLSVQGDSKTMVTGDFSLTISGDRKETTTGDQSLTVMGNRDEMVSSNYSTGAGQQITLVAGMNLVIQAGTKISLNGPGGFITIDSSGIAIQGTMVLINSGGSPAQGTAPGPASPDSPDNPDTPDNPDGAADPDDAQAAQPITPDAAHGIVIP